jgi:transposase-like protein
MQLWESELVYVPKCLHCHGRPRMHRHGACRRTGSDGLPTMLQRYRCPRCLRTCSILKDGMLPYRRVSAEQLQSCLDNPQHSQAKTESHKLLKPVLSAAKRFHERTRWLVMLMGPGLLRLPLGLTPGELSQRLWEALRRHYGDAATILRVLASSFRISLLHDYRCLIRPTPRF